MRPGAQPSLSHVRRRLGGALLLALAVLQAGCGFHLRRPPELAFRSVYADVQPTTVLGAELIRQFAMLENVELITDAGRRSEAQAILDVQEPALERNVVGVGATGQVREIQLRLALNFRLRTPQGKRLIGETRIVQERDISYTETGALAKAEEEALIFRSMLARSVDQLMRRLSTVRAL